MNDTAFIRARSPEHKAQRADDILAAAALVLDRDGIDAVTLAAIAREAGVVKSNIYRYFESREEILFRLMIEESERLIADGIADLDAIKTKNDIPLVARTLTAGFVAHPRFCLLISQMAPILERNISVEKLIEMKREIVALIMRISTAIYRVIPDLGEAGSMRALHTSIHYIAGLWPMANPPEAVKKALEQPDLAFMKQDFEGSMEAMMRALMEGIRVEVRST